MELELVRIRYILKWTENDELRSSNHTFAEPLYPMCRWVFKSIVLAAKLVWNVYRSGVCYFLLEIHCEVSETCAFTSLPDET